MVRLIGTVKNGIKNYLLALSAFSLLRPLKKLKNGQSEITDVFED